MHACLSNALGCETQFGAHLRSRQCLRGTLLPVDIQTRRRTVVRDGDGVPLRSVQRLARIELLPASEPHGEMAIPQDEAAAAVDVGIAHARNDDSSALRGCEAYPAGEGPLRAGRQQSVVRRERPGLAGSTVQERGVVGTEVVRRMRGRGSRLSQSGTQQPRRPQGSDRKPEASGARPNGHVPCYPSHAESPAMTCSIRSSVTPLVSGNSRATTISCSTIMAAKNANGAPWDRTAMSGNANEITAFMNQ